MLWQWWQQTYFEQPYWALLFLLLPLVYKYYHAGLNAGYRTIFVQPRFHGLYAVIRSGKFGLLVALCSGIVVATQPYILTTQQTTSGEGIDIMLCMDISGSMTEKDFTPTRLAAAKTVAEDFVNKRPGDRIGLVVFSARAYTLCPLTVQHATLVQQIRSVESGILGNDGTAIGTGLATSVVRLAAAKPSSRVIILLTDGNDFGGVVPSNQAIALAQQNQVKVYTIGINNANGEKHELLAKIAASTGGKYFEANDYNALQQVYNAIDGIEKSTVTVLEKNSKQYQFSFWIVVSALCFGWFIITQCLTLRLFPLA